MIGSRRPKVLVDRCWRVPVPEVADRLAVAGMLEVRAPALYPRLQARRVADIKEPQLRHG